MTEAELEAMKAVADTPALRRLIAEVEELRAKVAALESRLYPDHGRGS